MPDGTGYRPTGKIIDVNESAALQERARGDHQETLKLVKAMVEARQGHCLFNNNVDLLASFASQKLLVEAKSLTVQSAAVDRMRYGMGQLFDYGVRYRARSAGRSLFSPSVHYHQMRLAGSRRSFKRTA